MADKLIIINADDFGSSNGVNAAVARVRREGVLTSASLMMTGNAVEEAVSIAREDPHLAVGLHLALSSAKSVLPYESIPDLVDSDSCFGNSPIECAWRYYFSRSSRMQLKAEIEAQFEAFARTGLPLSHVDGHQHLHAHPAVLPAVIELAKQYGAKGIRIPRDPFFVNLRVDRTRLEMKVITALGHAYLARVCSHTMKSCTLAACDLSIGAMMSGSMCDDYVIRMLENVHANSIEIFFHPCAFGPISPQGPNPGDMEMLLSTRFREYILASGYKPATYAELSGRKGEAPAEPEAKK